MLCGVQTHFVRIHNRESREVWRREFVILLAADNLASPPTIKELTDRFNIGQSKFCSDFRRHTGSTYKKYLTDLRMARARDLLASGSSIINASLETGYSSEAHFIKAFHSYYGVTPGALRK